MGIVALLLFILVVAGMSVASYFGIEKQTGHIAKKRKKSTFLALITAVVVCLVTSGASGFMHLWAGVICDVPELGIEKTNVHRGMHAEYCDMPYSWNKDFESTGKVKIVVIWDSFGGVFANILNESVITDKIEISYIYSGSTRVYEDYKERLSRADLVFRSFSYSTASVEGGLPKNVDESKLYVV